MILFLISIAIIGFIGMIILTILAFHFIFPNNPRLTLMFLFIIDHQLFKDHLFVIRFLRSIKDFSSWKSYCTCSGDCSIDQYPKYVCYSYWNDTKSFRIDIDVKNSKIYHIFVDKDHRAMSLNDWEYIDIYPKLFPKIFQFELELENQL